MANNDARSAQHADETEQSRVSDTLNYKWLVFGLLLSRNTVSEWRVRHAIENCNLWTEHTHIIICDKLPHSMWNEACSDAVTTMSVERERESSDAWNGVCNVIFRNTGHRTHVNHSCKLQIVQIKQYI